MRIKLTLKETFKQCVVKKWYLRYVDVVCNGRIQLNRCQAHERSVTISFMMRQPSFLYYLKKRR
ncbi:MAG: hypothetical protein ACTSUE_19790 [Promethearchaeota archaeon]